MRKTFRVHLCKFVLMKSKFTRKWIWTKALDTTYTKHLAAGCIMCANQFVVPFTNILKQYCVFYIFGIFHTSFYGSAPSDGALLLRHQFTSVCLSLLGVSYEQAGELNFHRFFYFYCRYIIVSSEINRGPHKSDVDKHSLYCLIYTIFDTLVRIPQCMGTSRYLQVFIILKATIRLFIYGPQTYVHLATHSCV